MAAEHLDSPLIVIAGPTASGKTSLAIKLALKFDGEIICADSRTIYKEMNIGTAKPSADEQAIVPHWGLDLVYPNQPFNAAMFQQYAKDKIEEIRGRGHVPMLVGGTGLYIDSIIFDYEFGPAADSKEREMLEKLSLDELYNYCNKNNIELPENSKNKRYVIRAIEQKNMSTKRKATPIDNCIVVAIATDRNELRTRIKLRAEQLFEHGVVEEATILGKKYGWNNESMTGNIYPLVQSYLSEEKTLAEIKEKFTTLDWRLAKRQLTWLRRNKYIKWLSLTEAEEYINQVLAHEHTL